MHEFHHRHHSLALRLSGSTSPALPVVPQYFAQSFIRRRRRSNRSSATVCGFNLVAHHVSQCHFANLARVARVFGRPIAECRSEPVHWPEAPATSSHTPASRSISRQHARSLAIAPALTRSMLRHRALRPWPLSVARPSRRTGLSPCATRATSRASSSAPAQPLRSGTTSALAGAISPQ